MNLTFLLARATPIAPERLSAVRDAFRNVHDPDSPLQTVRSVLLAVGLLLLMLALFWLSRWIQFRHLRSQPMKVFYRLSGGLGLTPSDQLLLVRIARQQSLPSPLTLLLSPTTMRHHAVQFVQHLHRQNNRPKVLRRVASIRRRVFLEAA